MLLKIEAIIQADSINSCMPVSLMFLLKYPTVGLIINLDYWLSLFRRYQLDWSVAEIDQAKLSFCPTPKVIMSVKDTEMSAALAREMNIHTHGCLCIYSAIHSGSC